MMQNKLTRMVPATFFVLIIVPATVFMFGCATVRHAVPLGISENATIYGMQDIRAFGGKPNAKIIDDILGLLEQDKKHGTFFNKFPNVYTVLVISGGAQNGAFGAGFLNGWTKSGQRPDFNIVTGISAGAIIAPMAFIGKECDEQLKKMFTQYSSKDIFKRKGILPMLFSNSLVNTRPLKNLIDHNFDKDILEKVAQRYAKGNRLYVGTTSLDSQKLVIWDMGKIASIGGDKALELFRKVILASSSLPVVFPPVYINIDTNHKAYNEMHIDGAIAKDVFFIYDVLQGIDKSAKSKGINVADIKYKMYIIRNGYNETFWKEVPDSIFLIAQQSFNLLTSTKSTGDIYQLYEQTKANGGDFNLAFIPSHEPPNEKEYFDPKEMRRLFDIGYKGAEQGYPWRKVPPGLEENVK